MYPNKITKRTVILSLLTLSFLTILGFVSYIAIYNLTDTQISYFEQLSQAILPLIAGVASFVLEKKRKLKNSILGTSIVYFSLGLLTWSFGQFIWTAYNFILGIDVPFPSFADIGYVLTPISWLMGIVLLTKITGVKYKFRTVWGKTVAILIPLIVLIGTFYLVYFKFYQGTFFAGKENLGLILNIYYPLSDVVLLSSTLVIIVLSWKTLGGSLKKPITFILCSFIFMYIADIEFAYLSLNNLYQNGNWVDTLFTSSLFLLSFGINSISLPSFDLKNFLHPVQCEDIFAQLALKIIREEEKIIGSKAWEMAMQAPGLFVDENRTLRINGNKNQVINNLIAQYEQMFGQTSRELAKDAIKGLSTVANTLAIDAMVSLNMNSAIFFIRQASTGNFQSVFPFEEPKFSLDRHHPLIHRLTSYHDLVLKSTIPELIQQAEAISEASDLKEIDLELEKCKTIMVGGLYSDQALIGVLMLGEKAGGQPVSTQDLSYISHILVRTSRELALIVHYRDSQAAVFRMSTT